MVQAFAFLAVFAILQIVWLLVHDNSFSHFIRGDVTVKPAVDLINAITPSINASALDNQIKTKGKLIDC